MVQPSELRDGVRVLVVEDEGLIAEEISERLRRLGMTVVGVVDTADDAVRLARTGEPDIVLMDIRIKGDRDGVQATDEITRTLDVPVVYLTAHSDQATFARAKVSGPFGYVLKPFHERDLTIAIELAVHRHALDRRLKESERRYVATLASIGDAVVATDLDRRLTFMNPVAEKLTRWPFAEAQGRAVEEVVRMAQEEGTKLVAISPIGRALEARQALRFGDNLVLIARDDETVPIDDCASPIVDEQGIISGAVVAFRDVRERRATERALKRAQEDLFQAQKMEAIGRLAAGVAQDFNNLLTVINGCTELAMVDGGMGDSTRELLADVHKAGARASAITRQFLAFGRKQKLEARVIDLNLLVSELLAMLRRLIGEHIVLETHFAQGPILILADPSQIGLVLVNLTVNARDAMEQGGALTITTARRTVGGRPHAVLTVSDTGRGIDPAIQRQIFEPYFTTKATGKGSGLGLATVYGIVKQSDGFIEVDSEVGAGATFNVVIPLSSAEAAESVEKPAATVGTGHETILLVEDEDGVRSLVATVLRRNGYTVIDASHGAEALDKVAGNPAVVDLLVTDVVMPGITGPALAKRLHDLAPATRVLYMSGYTQDVKSESLDAAFIAKPFTPLALVKAVRDVLDRN